MSASVKDTPFQMVCAAAACKTSIAIPPKVLTPFARASLISFVSTGLYIASNRNSARLTISSPTGDICIRVHPCVGCSDNQVISTGNTVN